MDSSTADAPRLPRPSTGQRVAAVVVGIALLAFVYCVGVALGTYPALSRAQIAVEDARAALKAAESRDQSEAVTRARADYNAAAHRLNTEMERFPTRLITRSMAFVPAPYLDGCKPAAAAPPTPWSAAIMPAVLAGAFVALVVALMRRRG